MSEIKCCHCQSWNFNVGEYIGESKPHNPELKVNNCQDCQHEFCDCCVKLQGWLGGNWNNPSLVVVSVSNEQVRSTRE